MRRTLLFLGLIFLAACQSQPSEIPIKTPAIQAPAINHRRFAVVPEYPPRVFPGALALDTETGKLCRTYNWSVNEVSDILPMCFDLYGGPRTAEEFLKKYPPKN
jgi:hypothetical protein